MWQNDEVVIDVCYPPSLWGTFSCSSRWRPPGARRVMDPRTHNGNEIPSVNTHTHVKDKHSSKDKGTSVFVSLSRHAHSFTFSS